MIATSAMIDTTHHSMWSADAPVDVRAALGLLGPVSTRVPSSVTRAAGATGAAGVNDCFACIVVALSAASGTCVDTRKFKGVVPFYLGVRRCVVTLAACCEPLPYRSSWALMPQIFYAPVRSSACPS